MFAFIKVPSMGPLIIKSHHKNILPLLLQGMACKKCLKIRKHGMPYSRLLSRRKYCGCTNIPRVDYSKPSWIKNRYAIILSQCLSHS